MRSALKTLERIKKFELDEQQRILSAELEHEQALTDELNQLISCYEQEKAFVMQHPGICDFGAYTNQFLKKRRSLEQQIKNVRIKIEKIRDIMADIFKEQKTFSIVDENRRAARQKQIDVQEQKTLDEIGTNAYIKRHQN